jgi:hypothetical protein
MRRATAADAQLPVAVTSKDELLPMRSSDQEIARRVLSAVLDRLDGAPQPETAQTEPAPVVLILLGQHATSADGTTIGGERRPAPVASSALQREPSGPGSASTPAKHPGLEKFHLNEADQSPLAPKSCFMEPDRACVNSGACEMRGY